MDIQRLRQILEELNLIFWNPKIDLQIQTSNYQNHTPIASAEWRYEIAVKSLDHNTTKKHFDKLFKDAEECLAPYDKVFDVLRKEFTSLFAEQVLLSNEKLIKDFAGVSTDKFWPWKSLLVCMSHKDFWAGTTSTKQNDKDAVKIGSDLHPEKSGIWGCIWRELKRIWKVIVGMVAFLSALFACIHYWPEIHQKLQSLFSH